ncbi:PLP-dependent transferase [Aspergillus ellipticus CBS 707.79]|uniref:PLP-dependent transferase n=1 Tax=Aspergillus ellipticus CBS 707.79 TaxID=1448320 RepID=A0A319DC11_9EURO|nr:PLP-dependent transferase [Aspergillus ellipticus CBS 707.79]
MPEISEFAVERWMDLHENTATHNLAETCCASISLSGLLSLSSPDSKVDDLLDLSQKQGYGAIRGSDALRTNIANLYAANPDNTEETNPITKDNILVTSGGIQANFLALYTIVKPGDHVIVQYPTYQQLYSVPESLGAEVSLWRAKEEKGWEMDVDELSALTKPNTRVLVLNTPQNPTGTHLPLPTLTRILALAQTHSLTILSDEVYRPLFHSTPHPAPPSLLTLSHTPKYHHKNILITGSLSKAFSLAGLRTGWLASPSPALLEKCASVRDYTTISVSQIDDRIASVALSQPTIHNILSRNIALAKENLTLLEEFVREYSWAVSWVRPTAGTTAFLRFRARDGRVLDDGVFCERLLAETGVLVVPGRECFGRGAEFGGWVRVGVVQEEGVWGEGLRRVAGFLDGAGYEGCSVLGE